MIEEAGIAVSIEQDAVWVETRRKSTCGQCSARSMCGQELLERIGRGSDCHLVRAVNSYPVKVGDRLTIAIPEQVIIKGALLVYLMPLLLMMAALVICEALAFSEGVVILGTIAGLVVGFVLVALRSRYVSQNDDMQPRVIHVALGQSTAILAKASNN